MDKFVIAKYIRLSIDDVITDSMSIANQRRLLDKYIDELDIPGAEVLEFTDNGYTGTNFERPAVQELLSLVRSGGVDCILCKDLSRFGRSAIETEYFIEQVFPLYQVRFISVDESFDSDDYKGDTGGINITFRYLYHELYSRDLSHKVKSAKRIKMMRGDNIVANAIYGYCKNDSGRWEPDGDAADVVRKIFELALAGLSTAQIRDVLFFEGISAPREYHAMKKGAETTPSCLWSSRMVMHILSNEQYTGMYISGKQISKAVGSHSKIHTDKSEWIMIPDSHPPIVDKQTFSMVQKLLEKYRKGKIVRKPRDFLLRSKVSCGCCHYALSYDAISDPVFRCHHTQADPTAKCHKMKINVRELDEAVMTVIDKQLQVVLNCGVSEVEISNDRERHIAECEKQIQAQVERRQRIYEQFVEHDIDRDAYILLKGMCASRLSKLGQQLTMLRAEEHDELARRQMQSELRELKKQAAAPRELVDTLIKKIHVFPDNRIEIEWLISDFVKPE